MYQLKRSLLCLLFFKYTDAQTDEYCALVSCGDKPNTVCARKVWNCRPDTSKCGTDVKDLRFTPNQRRFYVAVHNKLRAKVASGEETRGDGTGQASASNMNALTFDRDLEYVAQCWTNNCKVNHDECRKTRKYSYAGQNLASYATTAPFKSINITARVENMITNWYNEVGSYKTQTTFQSSRNNGSVVSHYTQLVWAETKQVGCGLTFFKNGRWNTLFLACNYGPGGNVRGQSVYKEGPPASDCRTGKVHATYNALCQA